MSTGEIDDAAPLEAVKWAFVRRRLAALFIAHGYREVSPPPLELRGTHLLARRAAWPVGEDLELRADPILSLAQLYARASRTATPDAPALGRWMLSDVVFDPEASGPHHYPAWHCVAGALFGVSGEGPELESALLMQRIGVDLGLTRPSLRVSTTSLAPDAAARFRAGLVALSVPFVEHAERSAGAALPREGGMPPPLIDLVAQPADGPPITVVRGRRYDTLLGALGERPAPLFGLVAGLRRAAACTPGGPETYEAAAEVYCFASDDQSRLRALAAAAKERARGLRVEVELRELSREAQLARAASIRARVVVGFGVDRARVSVGLAGEPPREIAADDLSSALRRLLR